MGACGSPIHFIAPPEETSEAYKWLIKMIAKHFNCLHQVEHLDIFDMLWFIKCSLEQGGYSNPDAVEHPLFNIEPSKYDDEEQKNIDLNAAVSDIESLQNDNRPTLSRKLCKGLEIAHCFLQTAFIASVNGGCTPEMYQNHTDWAYTLCYTLEKTIELLE